MVANCISDPYILGGRGWDFDLRHNLEVGKEAVLELGVSLLPPSTPTPEVTRTTVPSSCKRKFNMD